jgi:hypothetical protein
MVVVSLRRMVAAATAVHTGEWGWQQQLPIQENGGGSNNCPYRRMVAAATAVHTGEWWKQQQLSIQENGAASPDKKELYLPDHLQTDMSFTCQITHRQT